MKNIHRTSRLFALLILSAGGCDIIGPDEPQDDVLTVVNGTDTPLFYIPIELESSHLFDPNPRFEVAPGQEGLLQPGESAALAAQDIVDYRPGDDLRFFLYEVSDGVAELMDLLTLTHEELWLRGFRVELVGEGNGFTASRSHSPAQEACSRSFVIAVCVE